MASQTQGIQQLLTAEKRAAEKVAEARKRNYYTNDFISLNLLTSFSENENQRVKSISERVREKGRVCISSVFRFSLILFCFVIVLIAHSPKVFRLLRIVHCTNIHYLFNRFSS